MEPRAAQISIEPMVRRLAVSNGDPAALEQLRLFIDSPGTLSGLDRGQLLRLAYLAAGQGMFAEAETVLRHGLGRFPEDPDFVSGLNIAAECPETVQPEEDDECCRPFAEHLRQTRLLQRYLEVFKGRGDVFARQWHDPDSGKSGYTPIRRPMSAGDLEDHLHGRATYGIYLMNPDDTVAVGALDLDLRPEFRRPGQAAAALRDETRTLLVALMKAAKKLGLATVPEFSGGKGFHLWFPVQGKVPAAVMRRALERVCAAVDFSPACYQIEIFPKQDHLSGKGLGNLIKLPLGIHRGSGKPSRFLLARGRGLEEQLEYLESLRPAPAARFLALAPEDAVPPAVAAHTNAMPPQLVALEQNCPVLAGIMASILSGRDPGFREERILFATLPHLDNGRHCLHYLLRHTPSYSAPLVDYKTQRVRGTVMGCRRIHRLLDAGDLECAFPPGLSYPHPLVFVQDSDPAARPASEEVLNLRDALFRLKEAITVVERFLPGWKSP